MRECNIDANFLARVVLRYLYNSFVMNTLIRSWLFTGSEAHSQEANMARIRWDVIGLLQHAYGWSDRRLAHEMGFSASYLCEMKKGKKPVSMDFVDKLVEVTRIGYGRLLIHPSIEDPEPSGSPVGITKQENGASMRGLCRDPEHQSMVMSPRQERALERQVAATIPQQTRKKLWARQNWA